MPNSVLIVDDEEGIRRTLSGVLEDEGLSVEAAAARLGEAVAPVIESEARMFARG